MEKSYVFLCFLTFLLVNSITQLEAQTKSVDSMAYYSTILENPKTNESLISAYSYFDELRKKYTSESNPTGEVYALICISRAQRKLGSYGDSEISAVEALKIIDQKEDSIPTLKNYKLSIVNHLGLLYRETNDLSKARSYYTEALSLAQKPSYKSTALNNIAYTFMKTADYKQAIPYLERALGLLEPLPNVTKETARSLHNLGFCLAKTNDQMGLVYLKEALRLRDSLNYLDGKFTSYLELSEIYQDQNKISVSKTYSLKAYELAQISNKNLLLKESLGRLLDLGNIEYYPKFKQLNDSLEKLKTERQNSYAALKYNTQKETDRANKIALELSSSELRLAQQRQLKFGVLFGGIFLTLLLVFTIIYQRARLKKQTLEKVYKTEARISKKVHDEVANEVFQVLTKLEANEEIKEPIIDDLQALYHKARDISKENALLDKNSPFDKVFSELAQTYSDADTNVMIQGNNPELWNLLTMEKRNALYKIVQELLINMKKHSQASLVVFRLKKRDKTIELSYTDNGQGCDLKKGNGLQNAENRIEAIKGNLNFDSEPGKGFRATLTV